ncbi:Prefoldin subunit 6 [Coemansia sp. RSA 1813]|nr:Prefoldin subunit 6 [Coemansia sp. RSA 1646]KAJ1768010.1 Prefoldin subunit 6 [Coemansia sp. RSA 1843]KAJ2086959.1 Prefoldin subunit 6 [Coemansia sp. RSA 986]KAJ2211771.1 Prefoldin subunit 6 [Coemansia sp. RSA 487]KAJ2564351.1 Prefoldin subunit 6 [Coemansia sp. RSA 1813]
MSQQQREKLELETMAFQKLQREHTTLVESRQKLESQLQENELVDKEFKILKDDARVYKMIGPVLVLQDKPEATANVEKRIEFIRSEMGRVEKRIELLGKDQEAKSIEIFKLQMDIQGVSKA